MEILPVFRKFLRRATEWVCSVMSNLELLQNLGYVVVMGNRNNAVAIVRIGAGAGDHMVGLHEPHVVRDVGVGEESTRPGPPNNCEQPNM